MSNDSFILFGGILLVVISLAGGFGMGYDTAKTSPESLEYARDNLALAESQDRLILTLHQLIDTVRKK